MLSDKTIKQFLLEGFKKQEEYALKFGVPSPLNITDEEAEKYVNEFLMHIVEEVIEARQLVPRKFWKQESSYLSSEDLKREFCKELCDILLFLRSVIIYSKIPLEDVLSYFEEKIEYNNVRQDHAVPNRHNFKPQE